VSTDEPLNTYDLQDAINLLRSYTRHRDFVRLALHRVANAFAERAIVHDASKLLDDEFSGFSRINKAARVNKFGSEEYKAGMRAEKPVIDLHFSRNSHHPEHATYGAPDGSSLQGSEVIEYDAALSAREQTFLDVIEMVCDWWGAGRGYGDPRPWTESAALNFKSKGKYLTPEQRWLAEQVVAFLAPASTEEPAK
jgi:hypothetical protein